jgi:hypothetical protein
VVVKIEREPSAESYWRMKYEKELRSEGGDICL